jgi:hypothetical protein
VVQHLAESLHAVGLPRRVYGLKHTFGRRLRQAGVSFENRHDVLWHCSGRITKHYSAVELQNLSEAATVCAGSAATIPHSRFWIEKRLPRSQQALDVEAERPET